MTPKALPQDDRNIQIVEQWLGGASQLALAESYGIAHRAVRRICGTDSSRAAPMVVRPILLAAGKPVQG